MDNKIIICKKIKKQKAKQFVWLFTDQGHPGPIRVQIYENRKQL